ncbi:MAG TPA: DinB family protein, partial [Gemmatimonadaceae bacterium]|nr:DinB family protein [Gemmatimonadaceae bacterium]
MGVHTDVMGAGVESPLARRYRVVRGRTERLCAPLAVEDYVVTAMTDASPAKWHLAHTTWFFETFVLREGVEGYGVFDPAFAYLFNSYYVQAGERHCRAQRGLVTRPTVAEVYAYRRFVDDAMVKMVERGVTDALAAVMEIGMQHEQQHQELLVTDLKYLFDANPIKPAYDERPLMGAVPVVESGDAGMAQWIEIVPGVTEFGGDGVGFAYD